ncbi:hypothetical protein [Nonlabens spongiae]|nr:hypothetical protein [Nonlabens spongiae]
MAQFVAHFRMLQKDLNNEVLKINFIIPLSRKRKPLRTIRNK